MLEVTAQRRHFKFAVICNLYADCTHLREDDERIDSSGQAVCRSSQVAVKC